MTEPKYKEHDKVYVLSMNKAEEVFIVKQEDNGLYRLSNGSRAEENRLYPTPQSIIQHLLTKD